MASVLEMMFDRVHYNVRVRDKNTGETFGSEKEGTFVGIKKGVAHIITHEELSTGDIMKGKIERPIDEITITPQS